MATIDDRYPWTHSQSITGMWTERKHHYENTGSPLFAWTTAVEALENDLPLPEWVRNYLIQTGRSIMEVNSQLYRTPTLAREAPQMVAEAAGFFKRGKPFTKYARTSTASIVRMLVNLLTHPQGGAMKSKHAAYSKLAKELRVGHETIRRRDRSDT